MELLCEMDGWGGGHSPDIERRLSPGWGGAWCDLRVVRLNAPNETVLTGSNIFYNKSGRHITKKKHFLSPLKKKPL